MPVVLDFEEGSDGGVIPTSGTIQQAVGARYTADSMHDNLALVANVGEYIRANFTHGVEHSGSIYFKASAITSSRWRLVNFAATTDANIIVIGLHNDGKIDLSITAREIASAVSWMPDTWHRIDWQYVEASKRLTIRIFLDPEAAVHDDEISFASPKVEIPAKWSIGALTSASSGTVQVDTLRAEAGLVWLGPHGTPSAPTPGDVLHHWVGAPTTDGFSVTSKTTAATSVRLAVGTDTAVTQNLQYVGPTTPSGPGYAAFTATGLTSGATYYYQLEDTPSGGSPTRIGSIGKAKTLVTDRTAYTFAFGNCTTDGNQGMEAYDEIVAADPLFFVHLGDFHYENSLSADAGVHRYNLENQIANVSGLKTLIQTIPTLYLRSDHDGGGTDNSDAGAYYQANQTAAKQVAPLPPLANQPTDALYYSWVVGRVRYIVLDIRNMYRSPGADPQSSSKTMLGAVQKQWLKDRLLDAEPVKVIISDTPWLGAASLTDGIDKWWAYDDERTEIGQFISDNSVNALMITGDLHSIYADDGTNNQWGNFPIIGAGPLANVGGFRGGPYQQLWSSGGSTQARSFGKVTVSDTGGAITLSFVGRDALNNIDRVTYEKTWALPSWYQWDGTAEQPLALEGVWNGTSVDSASYEQQT